MDKIDYKKIEKELYLPTTKPENLKTELRIPIRKGE